MSDDDDDMPPELEDFTEQLKQIRKNKGIDEKNVPSELKVGVINEKKEPQKPIQIPITTTPPISNPNPTPSQQQNPKPKPESKPIIPGKRDENDFGCGLFKRGFLRRHNFNEEPKKKPNPSTTTTTNNKNTTTSSSNKKEEPVDLTHIKAAPGTNTKTETLNQFNKDLKTSQQTSNLNPNLLNNLANNQQQWLNQELLMKIAKNPNLMRCFMDPRFSTVIQELQKNPQECLKKYGNNPEFSTFIKEFSSLMGAHFTDLAKNPMAGNPNYSTPEVQEIINDPKIKPILEKLQKEGKLDINEINADPYIASKFKVLIDK